MKYYIEDKRYLSYYELIDRYETKIDLYTKYFWKCDSAGVWYCYVEWEELGSMIPKDMTDLIEISQEQMFLEIL